MSLQDLYNSGNKQDQNTNVHCNSVNTNELTFNGVDYQTSLTPDYFIAVKTTNESIANNTSTDVTNYDTNTGPISGEFNTTTGIWTVGTSGLYSINFRASFPINNTGYRFIYLSGGTDYAGSTGSASGGATLFNSSSIQELTAGATVNMGVKQTSGVPLNLLASRLAVARLGPI